MRHAIRDEGKGEVVVLLHGLVPGAEVFDVLVPDLARTHRVLVPDLAGYGRTPLNDGHSIEASVADLESDLLKLGVERCRLVGFSGGGFRAIAMAVSGRIRVQAVVTLAGYAGLGEEHRTGLRQLAAAARSGADVGAIAGHTMFSELFASKNPHAVERVRSQLRALPTETLASELEAGASCADLRPSLKTIGCRVTVRAGDADLAMPLSAAQDIASNAPRATLEVVPGAGHALLEEDFEGTCSSIRRGIA